MNDIGKKIYARNKATEGIIEKMVRRWCAGCQCERPVYSVKWENGRRTFPCPAGCKDNPDRTIEII